MRSFIAIELPEAVKTILVKIQENFKKCGNDMKWINPGGIHLTLKFLGNIQEDAVEEIVRLMKKVCGGHNKFTLTLKGAGMFPNPRSPRVLWVGIREAGALAKLKQEIDDNMTSRGFKREDRRYTPHLTLGRFRSFKGIECFHDIMKQHEGKDFGAFQVHSLSLMRSDLHPGGARYSRIACVSLGD
jgi:2'-5' RNA ligase